MKTNYIDSIKKTIQKSVALGLITAMTISVGVIPVAAGDYVDDLKLKYNGNVYQYKDRIISVNINDEPLNTGDMPAVLVENTTMVPVREFFESNAIDATVTWNGANQQVYISYKDKFIVLTIDSKVAYVNNEAVDLIVPAMLIQDTSKSYAKTMIPLRFVSENLGYDVDWDSKSFTAEIDTGDKSAISNPTPDDSDDTAPDGNDTVTDSQVVSGEQLDRLEGTDANRELPTSLRNNPVVFNAKGNVEEEIDESYSEAEIEAKDYDLVSIDDIDYVEWEDGIGFEIDATGRISSVETHVWDGKFIIEIHNADVKLKDATIDYKDNPIVTAVRAGEHVDEDGNTFTKIVFDLKAVGYKFNLSLSEDRETLRVDAVNNSIYQVKLGQNDKGDYIDITGVNATIIKAFRLSNPSRIVFDMPNTKSLLEFQESDAEGQYVTAIRTAQFDGITSRIVVETDGHPDYQVIELDDETTRIQILEPTYENITYDNSDDTPTIVIDKDVDAGISIDNISYKDDYLNRRYIITLPGDYTDYFGSGQVNINDSIINDITFELNKAGDTEVVINSTSVHEFRIKETDSGLTIKAYKPAQLYSKVIVVDAGHGGNDPGAVYNDYYESTTTLGVTLELKKLLDKDSDIKVYYTRLVDERPSLADRCILANEVEADFFLSIHCNSFTPNFSGTETLYLPGPDTKGLNAFELAEIFQETFPAYTELEDYLAKQRDNLYVLKKTDMPAIILEMGYLSNDHDRQYLADADYFDELAYGVYKSIEKTFEEYPTGR